MIFVPGMCRDSNLPSQDLFSPAPASSTTGVIHGIVREGLSDGPGEPIAGVLIQLRLKSGFVSSVVSGVDGHWQLDGVGGAGDPGGLEWHHRLAG